MSQERQPSPENEDPLRGEGPEQSQSPHVSGGAAYPTGSRNGDALHTPSDVTIPPAGMVNGGHSWQPDDQPYINRIAVARFGMVLVIVVEAMTFAGLISAFLSIRASLDFWPPLDQPRYPVVATAINTAVLLASGVTMLLFMWRYRKPDASVHTLTLLLVVTLALGGLFLGLTGHRVGQAHRIRPDGNVELLRVDFLRADRVPCHSRPDRRAVPGRGHRGPADQAIPTPVRWDGSRVNLLVLRSAGLADTVWSGLLLAWRAC